MGRFPQAGWFGRFGKRDREAVDSAISAMGLQDIESRQISELSGGQQQRAFISRALAQEAHILLLDEPYAGLDVESQGTLTTLLHGLAGSGHLVFASHHDLKMVTGIFSHAVLLDRRMLDSGPAGDVIGRMNLP
jgi:ABC-type Mn2+/Zn2+ transport system ATPase subunit